MSAIALSISSINYKIAYHLQLFEEYKMPLTGRAGQRRPRAPKWRLCARRTAVFTGEGARRQTSRKWAARRRRHSIGAQKSAPIGASILAPVVWRLCAQKSAPIGASILAPVAWRLWRPYFCKRH